MEKFISAFDLHFGYERRSGHKVSLHDNKAWNIVMEFAKDFKPDVFIHGGDMLDCGVISHHNKKKPGNVEGLRLLADAEEGYKTFIQPITAKKKVYMIGNHEDWLNDLIIETPALEGIIDIRKLLKLNDWEVIEQGGIFNFGKLTFLHGDTVKGGEHVAKAAVINYERNVRFGHHHTHQVYTKTSPINYKNAKTGVAVGCLCTKDPKYGESKPNRWGQGFLYGYVDNGGYFNDYYAVIVDGKAWISGKQYKG